jgi:TolA-binding protein
VNAGLIIALIAGFGGLGAGAVALFTMGAQRRKISAEGSKAMAEANEVFLKSGMTLMTAAEAKAERLEKKLSQAEDRITELEASLSKANRTVLALTDRLQLAQRTMTEAGLPFPPAPED